MAGWRRGEEAKTVFDSFCGVGKLASSSLGRIRARSNERGFDATRLAHARNPRVAFRGPASTRHARTRAAFSRKASAKPSWPATRRCFIWYLR